ncbi:MAG: carboxypeptidase-like regulatory domain-containing protein [Bacteroidetes bacterium]|nr:carboxypeptidase-like regulatory domain-containing protein [Bacteroidota bacterium]
MKKLFVYLLGTFFFLPFVGLAQKSVVVTGTVVDSRGGTIAGASIQQKGRNGGTTTDNDGLFRIKVLPGGTIYINAVGFQGDTIKIADTATRMAVVLQPRIKSLEGIVITGTDQKAVANDPMHTMVTRSAGATITDFLRSEAFYSGQTIVNPYTTPLEAAATGTRPGYDQSKVYITNTPANTFYRMSALPAFSIKEDTKGNRYLLGERWGQGVVVTRADSLVDNKALLFNFDKIQQKLYTTKDMNTIIELEPSEIKAFAIKDKDSLMIFDRVAAIDSGRYFLVLVPAVSGKYALYRDLRTRFVKSDYHSDGMTESGNPYDEYVDNNTYYVVLPGGLKARRIEMKKKYIKDILPEDANRVNQYFSKHRYDPIDEALLKDLILFLNDAPVSLLTHK